MFHVMIKGLALSLQLVDDQLKQRLLGMPVAVIATIIVSSHLRSLFLAGKQLIQRKYIAGIRILRFFQGRAIRHNGHDLLSKLFLREENINGVVVRFGFRLQSESEWR